MNGRREQKREWFRAVGSGFSGNANAPIQRCHMAYHLSHHILSLYTSAMRSQMGNAMLMRATEHLARRELSALPPREPIITLSVASAPAAPASEPVRTGPISRLQF